MSSTTHGTKVPRAVAVLAVMVALAGCAGTAPGAVRSGTPTTTATASPDDPGPTSVAAPASEPLAADAPPNTAVPADQVDAVRAGGRQVYVLITGSGEGVLVDPTPGAQLPPALISDARSLAAQMNAALDIMVLMPGLDTPMEEAGLSAFFLRPAAMDSGAEAPAVGYKVSPVNVAGASEYYDSIDQKMGYATKDEARAEMTGLLAANPTVAFVDLTD